MVGAVEELMRALKGKLLDISLICRRAATKSSVAHKDSDEKETRKTSGEKDRSCKGQGQEGGDSHVKLIYGKHRCYFAALSEEEKRVYLTIGGGESKDDATGASDSRGNRVKYHVVSAADTIAKGERAQVLFMLAPDADDDGELRGKIAQIISKGVGELRHAVSIESMSKELKGKIRSKSIHTPPLPLGWKYDGSLFVAGKKREYYRPDFDEILKDWTQKNAHECKVHNSSVLKRRAEAEKELLSGSI
eukprot:jgi/Bigna1/135854/aug1.31_g10562